jgi:hypothetical protein
MKEDSPKPAGHEMMQQYQYNLSATQNEDRGSVRQEEVLKDMPPYIHGEQLQHSPSTASAHISTVCSDPNSPISPLSKNSVASLCALAQLPK